MTTEDDASLDGTMTITDTSGEQTPLLISRTESSVTIQSGSASFSQTVINIAKTCMGTGTLALPYAARQGGILLHIFGLVAIAGWNLYSVQRLLDCVKLLPQTNNTAKDAPPPQGTSTLGRVAWYSLGRHGLVALDIMMVMLLAGIVITYEDAIMSFLRDTPFSTGTLVLDAVGTSILIGILSVVPDMGYLAKASATGLAVLALTFAVICLYGDFSSTALSWWPLDGMSGVSTWFGCSVFGFGMVPLTYNLQESMVEPQQMMGASLVGLAIVAVSYISMGIGLLLLYPDIQGDLLQELPKNGFVPTILRLAMVLVVMVTAPLLVVPCGQLVEGKIAHHGMVSESTLRILVRLGICMFCAIVSVSVPGFVQVLSFVGCFCVALVGFVVPPLLHLVLLNKAELSPSDAVVKRQTHVLDIVMLVWGVSATIITSSFTLRELTS